MMEPSLLQYKVLIHLDEVRDYRGVDEPLFLRESSDSGESGLPERDDDMDRGGGNIALSRPGWQFGVRDACGAPVGHRRGALAAGGEPRSAGAVASDEQDWRLPCMQMATAVAPGSRRGSIRDRIVTRPSAFDRLTFQMASQDRPENPEAPPAVGSTHLEVEHAGVIQNEEAGQLSSQDRAVNPEASPTMG